MEFCLGCALAALGVREVGNFTAASRWARTAANWKDQLLARGCVALDTETSAPPELWGNLARSLLAGQLQTNGWSFQSASELDAVSANWRGIRPADLAGVALFKELFRQHLATFGKEVLSDGFYRSHLRALRRCGKVSAAPVTFIWPTNASSSQPLQIGLAQGALDLCLEQSEQCLVLSAQLVGASPVCSHLCVVSIEPWAPFVVALLGKQRPSGFGWVLPGFDRLPRWWPAFGWRTGPAARQKNYGSPFSCCGCWRMTVRPLKSISRSAADGSQR